MNPFLPSELQVAVSNSNFLQPTRIAALPNLVFWCHILVKNKKKIMMKCCYGTSLIDNLHYDYENILTTWNINRIVSSPYFAEKIFPIISTGVWTFFFARWMIYICCCVYMTASVTDIDLKNNINPICTHVKI